MLQSAVPSHITVLRPHRTASLKEYRAKNQKRWKQMTPQKPEHGYKLCCSLSQLLTRSSPLLPFPLDCRLLAKQTDLDKQSTAAAQDAQVVLEKVGEVNELTIC